MEALCSSEEMLTKATQLWTMLDDMAENNPKSYCHFMRQQLKEAEHHYAPPEPCLCLKTSILEPSKTCLFINLCRWSRVPAPKSPSEPVLLSAGKMETLSDKSETCSVLDMAYNPSVLERVEDNPPEKDQLIRMSLKYVEEHFNITLSHSWSVAKFKLKGSLERMRASLRREQPPLAVPQRSPSEEVTLSQLRSLMAEDSSDLILPEAEKPTASKKRLIEEISSTDKPEAHKPAYKMTTKKDANKNLLEIELKIELPGVRGVSECNLSVSKDDVLVECLEKYRLRVDLPAPVDEEATSASFNKKKGVLIVRMPVLNTHAPLPSSPFLALPIQPFYTASRVVLPFEHKDAFKECLKKEVVSAAVDKTFKITSATVCLKLGSNKNGHNFDLAMAAILSLYIP